VDRPIDAVAVRCYEEDVDGNCSSQSRGIQLPAARRVAVARHEEKKDMSQYTVKQGDTLWGIAQSQCGDGSVWPKIYHENRWVIGNNPNLIHPGQVLYINCPTPGGIWYLVEPGDNLTKIAENVCGNDDWQKIYNENKNVIGGNPNLIHPGQVLHIVC
jgi:nucleoid-associated protein YgaU